FTQRKGKPAKYPWLRNRLKNGSDHNPFLVHRLRNLLNQNIMKLMTIIENAWEDRSLLKEKEVQIAIKSIIADLDTGMIRVAEPQPDGSWKVNGWVKKAVILYFPIQQMRTIEVGPFEFHDKMALKTNYAKQGVRVVPHAIARYGAF